MVDRVTDVCLRRAIRQGLPDVFRPEATLAELEGRARAYIRAQVGAPLTDEVASYRFRIALVFGSALRSALHGDTHAVREALARLNHGREQVFG